MASFTDQTGKTFFLPNPPRRIVSLVPSQTELLFDLGLHSEVVGITKFCIHPDQWFRSKTRVGGTRQLNLSVIRRLKPDFIIANKEENVKEQVEKLAAHYPVYTSDVNDLDSACEMIQQVGALVQREQRAQQIVEKVRNDFSLLPPKPRFRNACYLIWREPYMTIGGDTFIHDMLRRAGFENMYGNETRYPEISMKQLLNDKPAYLLLSSEPYPFREKHVSEFHLLLPLTRIMLVDGEMFSWYGSRLLQAPSYYKRLMQVTS